MAGSFDVAVVGLGAAGSPVLRALARRGAKVVGLDRHAPPHAFGSSHGETRIFRTAYGEGAAYSPILKRSRELWLEAERELGVRLFEPSGLVYAGPRSSAFLAETLRSGEVHGLDLETIDERERLGFRVPDDWIVFLEPGAGFLHAERSIEAFLSDAAAHGAEIRTGAPCLALDDDGEGVRLATAEGEVRARQAVVAAGAWTPALLPELAPVLSIERRTLHWFADPDGRWSPEAGFRSFYIEDEAGQTIYGFPDWSGSGIKIAEHARDVPLASPADVDWKVRPADEERIRALASRFFEGLGPIRRSAACMYPMSRDEHFVVGRMPGREAVIAAAGLCGHGFKFAPLLGEAVCALALGEEPEVDLKMFAPERFAFAS
jgi:sarcosine oxidase